MFPLEYGLKCVHVPKNIKLYTVHRVHRTSSHSTLADFGSRDYRGCGRCLVMLPQVRDVRATHYMEQ